ncbi:hypothetical protein E2C01_032808 [Portunus trituberculatus]|uniref:Uncharacterized protein n=1 Tax=Portunus trituberculatus TaxID=210409 RepID=A0A5B7F1C1_PORTR|nr:hypothetical protein [Portunus trituberculatus]
MSGEMGPWERLLGDADDTRVWRAISWKGDLETSAPDNENRPSDGEYKLYFKHMLNPDPVPLPLHTTADVTIPILDTPILPTKADCQIRKVKADKACGLDGFSPGVLAMLPPAWLFNFNNFVYYGIYIWCFTV